ncbi:MAG: tetratricopeptide repeat protein [Bryobacteraceae bacterium]
MGCHFAGTLARYGLLSALSVCLVAAQTSFSSFFQQGTEAMRAGRLDAAAADFSRCLKAVPGSASAHFNLGLVRFQQGRWSDATGEFGAADSRDNTRLSTNPIWDNPAGQGRS